MSDDHPAPPQLDRALDVVRFLRAHCSWDAEQTPRSLVRHLLEEAHEVVDAIHADEADRLCDELGDLLLNLAFQVVIAEENERFDAEAVAAGLEDKMRRRHPHLYGLGAPQDWEVLKARERQSVDPSSSALDGIPGALDAAHKAHRLQQRAAAVGFDWPDASGALAKLHEELAEVEKARADPEALEEELGDLLFSVMNVTRLSGLHGADVLSRANQKFERRFRRMEALARNAGTPLESLTLEAMDALWDEAKRAEGRPPPLPGQ